MKGVQLEINGSGDPQTSDQARVRVVHAPRFAGDKSQEDLDISPLGAQGQAPVQALGDLLFQRLSVSDNVQLALAPYKTPTSRDLEPLYLRILDAKAALLPWEMLRVGNNFVSLNRNRPIARITELRERRPNQFPVLGDQLKVMSIMSMLGQDNTKEWNALSKSVQELHDGNAVSANQLNVELRVLAGDQAVVTAINDAPLPASVNASANLIPGKITELKAQIETFKPQVLHLYCHGSAKENDQRLFLGSPADWLSDDEGPGALRLALGELADSALRAGVWLIVINACQGAAATEHDHSLADQLVAEGVPAVVGHRVLIQPNDANLFCGSIFGALFSLFRNKLSEPGLQEIEWAELLFEPRSDLRDRHDPPEVNDHWSYPILHVGADEFFVQVAAAATVDEVAEETEVAVELQALAGAREAIAVRGDTPPEVLAALDQLMQLQTAKLSGGDPQRTTRMLIQ